jgi:hypothetical protein
MALNAEIRSMATAATHRVCPSFDGMEEAKSAFVHTGFDRIPPRVAVGALLFVVAVLTAFVVRVTCRRVCRLPTGGVVFGQ